MPKKKEKNASPDYPQMTRNLLEASLNAEVCKLPAGLYLVPTPLGHLGDITLRALMTLAQADVIACEDTRTSGVLLHAFGISTPTLAYHEHNEDGAGAALIARMEQGQAVALISDAGTPGIADPGFRLVRACRAAGHAVTVLPGACAVITALAGSGLPTDCFLFAGFLPPKSAARQTKLTPLRRVEATLIFYESPARLAASLTDMKEILGPDRPAVVTREISKLFEETRQGTLAALAQHYAQTETKGEIVILVGGRAEEDPIDLDALLIARLSQLSLRDAVAEVAALTGLPKKEVYARALDLSAL